MQPIVRPSIDSDIPAIAAIYREHVLHGTASFEVEPPGEAEMAKRREAVLAAGYPYLVAEIDGRVAGYAYAGKYHPRIAYQHTTEDSIYIDDTMRGRGIGKALLSALLAECEAMGLRQMVAVIGDSANSGSIELHRKLGFRHVGITEAVGFKHGKWLDVVFMQKTLGQGASTKPE